MYFCRVKHLLFIIVFISVLAQSARQAIIITVFKLNREYISRNLCINRFDKLSLCKGSCRLDEQLKKETREQNKGREQPSGEQILFCQHLTIEIVHIEKPKTYRHKNHISYNLRLPLSAYSSAVFRPPVPMV